MCLLWHQRRLQRETTGSAVLGVPTGLAQLDNLLGGLNEGLYLLAGPPGMGKTTLALQLAVAATKDVPVVVVTFEHAPANLTLKLLCARAGMNPRDVQRGYADLAKLQAAAAAWEPTAQRLAVVEGSSQLTVAQVRAQARRAMRQHQTERCLVIVDYLQLWAKVAEDLRGGRVVWSKYSNSPSHWRLRIHYGPRFGLSSAPCSPIISVNRDGKGWGRR